MSTISIIILGFILLIVFGINMVRKSKLTVMKQALQIKNYDAVIATAESSLSRRLCTPYVCNLYLLRANFFKLEEAAFLELLKEILEKTPEKTNRKDFLEIYFHIYINKQQQEAALRLLELIEHGADRNFALVSRFAYAIAFEKQSDEAGDIEAAIETLRGFELGVAVYYLGEYYELKQDQELALEYYESGLGCFDPSHYYSLQMREKIERLKEELEE